MNDIDVKPLCSDEMHLLKDLFIYNDYEEMVQNNSNAIDSGQIDIFGLFLKGSLIGELRVMYCNRDERFAKKGQRAYLYAFRIHKEYQGLGLGKYLLNYVIDQLTNIGYTEFTVGAEDDNERAKFIYRTFGFDILLDRIQEEYQGERYEYTLYLKQI